MKGTPTDCVIMGVRHIMKDEPDLVISGVNRGRNAAEDVIYSGTVAGGDGRHHPGRAVFRAVAGLHVHHQACAALGNRDRARAGFDQEVIKEGMPRDVLVNINFPDCAPADVKGIGVSTQGKRDQELLRIEARMDGRSNPYYWIAFARGGTMPEQGRAAISPRSTTTRFR